MGNYRPITDVWILGRAKYRDGVKRYGGYLGGFPERARTLLGADLGTPVLHVCGGKARQYCYQGGFGPSDATLDLDPAVSPDFLQDAREPWPGCYTGRREGQWPAVLIDPPYSSEDATKYPPGAKAYPTPEQLLKRAVDALAPGGRVGIIHYLWPRPVPGLSKEIAVVAVGCGRNSRARWFTVFEKLP